MTASSALDDWRSRNKALIARVVAAVANLGEANFNRRPDSHAWSPAQVVEHMVLAHKPYLETISGSLPRAVAIANDPPIRYSFFGRLIMKGVGPGGKAPVPKFLKPRETTIPLGIVEDWQSQQTQLAGLLAGAAGKDLSNTPVRNPFFRFIPMNLADCFEILTLHSEGHVAQIEERGSR